MKRTHTKELLITLLILVVFGLVGAKLASVFLDNYGYKMIFTNRDLEHN